MCIREFFFQRLVPREFNMFSMLKNDENSCKINLISYHRYLEITSFLSLGGEQKYVDKTIFVKSTKNDIKNGKPKEGYQKHVYHICINCL